MERSEGDMSLKNPVTPPGIDPRTVRLVAQRLNHYATPGPEQTPTLFNLYISLFKHISNKSASSVTVLARLIMCNFGSKTLGVKNFIPFTTASDHTFFASLNISLEMLL